MRTRCHARGSYLFWPFSHVKGTVDLEIEVGLELQK